MTQSLFSGPYSRAIFTIGIVVLAVSIFIIDAITPIEVSVSILYVLVVLVASLVYGVKGIVLVALACAVLTIASHLLSEEGMWSGWAIVDRGIGLFGLAVSTLLVLRSQAATQALQLSEAYLTEAQQLSHTGSVGWQTPHDDQFWSRETYLI